MGDFKVKSEISVQNESMIIKLDKLTTTSSPKVNIFFSQLYYCEIIKFQFGFLIFEQAPSIKDFAIIKPISRGAFGKVFLGYKNNDPSKLYAIKVSFYHHFLFNVERNFLHDCFFFV